MQRVVSIWNKLPDEDVEVVYHHHQGTQHRSWDIMLQIHKMLVRPQLEHCSCCTALGRMALQTSTGVLPGSEAYKERLDSLV